MRDVFRFESLARVPTLRHLVTTRDSSMAYDFSLALHTGEEASLIGGNREEIAQSFGDERSWSFVVAHQTHSANVVHITQPHSVGWSEQRSAVGECDGLITNLRGVVLTILTADCLPILLYDPRHHAIAALHAGWRGASGGIISHALSQMSEVFGTQSGDVVAGVGPAIGGCCYEVGGDVAEHFGDYPSALTSREEEGKYSLDLPLVAKLQLLELGVSEKNIEMSGLCTACEVERFFSYRREGGCTGRFMSMIGLV